MRFLGIIFFLTNPSGARDSQMNLDIAVLEISFGIDLNRHTSATDSDWPTFFLYHEPQEIAENRLSQCTKKPFPGGPDLSEGVLTRPQSFGRAPSDANGAQWWNHGLPQKVMLIAAKRNDKPFKIFKHGINCGIYIGIDKSNRTKALNCGNIPQSRINLALFNKILTGWSTNT